MSEETPTRHGSDGLMGYESMRCAAGMDGCDDRACICLCHHRLGSYEEAPYGCPTCRTILNAKAAGGCPDLWHSDNRPEPVDLTKFDVGRFDDWSKPVGSAPLSEEPTPPPVLPVEGFDQHVPVFTDVECPQCEGGRCDCFGKQVKICAADDEDWPCPPAAAYALGISEATEGWEREWGFVRPGRLPVACDDEHEARRLASYGTERYVVSRPAGPWEPAEQPELGKALTEEEIRAALKMKVAPEEFRRESLGIWPERRERPRMTDGCGPEHTYRGSCEYAGETDRG